MVLTKEWTYCCILNNLIVIRFLFLQILTIRSWKAVNCSEHITRFIMITFTLPQQNGSPCSTGITTSVLTKLLYPSKPFEIKTVLTNIELKILRKIMKNTQNSTDSVINSKITYQDRPFVKMPLISCQKPLSVWEWDPKHRRPDLGVCIARAIRLDLWNQK